MELPQLLDQSPKLEEARRALYAKKMNLATMMPCSDLASTKYCLANPGREYLVYLPEGVR